MNNTNLLLVGGGTALILYLFLKKKEENPTPEGNDYSFSENTRLSKDFVLGEFEYSSSISKESKVTDPNVFNAIQALTVNVLQPLRDYLNTPMHIMLGYLSKKNALDVSGEENSIDGHKFGEAVDISVKDLTPYQVAKAILNLNLPFDRMLLSNNYLHVSYKSSGNRRQIGYLTGYTGKSL
jgi:hypothetical protein